MIQESFRVYYTKNLLDLWDHLLSDYLLYSSTHELTYNKNESNQIAPTLNEFNSKNDYVSLN